MFIIIDNLEEEDINNNLNDGFIDAKQIPNSHNTSQYVMQLTCRTNYLKSAVNLLIKRDGHNYHVKDEAISYHRDTTHFAQAGRTIYINYNDNNNNNNNNNNYNYNLDSNKVTYICEAYLNNLDVYPYNAILPIGNHTVDAGGLSNKTQKKIIIYF